MRVRYQAAPHPVRIIFVGVAGFEPATSCSQSRRDDRATLHPEKVAPKIALITKFANALYILSHRFFEALFGLTVQANQLISLYIPVVSCKSPANKILIIGNIPP